METVNQKNGTLFREFDSTKENRYDTKGMELVSLGISYNISQNLQLSGILNHVSSGIGIGNEGILSAIYHLTSSNWGSGFLLTSICLARVNPVTQKKILYDDCGSKKCCFEDYNNFEEAVKFFCEFINNQRDYRNHFDYSNNYTNFSKIANSGYCTSKKEWIANAKRIKNEKMLYL